MRIDMDKMKFGTPEYEAAMTINVCEEELSNMPVSDFELWLKNSWSRTEIVLSGMKLKVPEDEKKAILHFIAFWYYRQKVQS